MRIRVQNTRGDLHFEITPGQWDAAMERAGETGHEVSVTSNLNAGRAAVAEADALVGPKGAVRALFPAAAPRLRLIFCMNAGLDGIEPFDWLPPGAALLNNRGAHAARAGEYAIMALLMLAARVPAFIADQRAERWEQPTPLSSPGAASSCSASARSAALRRSGPRSSGCA